MSMVELPKSNLEWLWDNTVFLTKHGSHAYGMATPASDLDIRGFCIPPMEYFLGYHSKFEQAEFKGDPDIVNYNIQKFFKLAADCNPNILEMLFTDESDHLKVTRQGLMVLENRDLFLSAKAKHTFSGYAIAQLKRIKAHHKWVNNPPKEPGYGEDVTEWRNYQEWLKTRNDKRLQLELKYGYDTKHAMHLVRLMRMCREILTMRKVIVKRHDKEELMAIRNGAWEYEHLLEWAEVMDREMEIHYQVTTLPKTPNHAKLEELLVGIIST